MNDALVIQTVFSREYLRGEITQAHTRYWASRLVWRPNLGSLGFEITEREDHKPGRGGGPTIHEVDTERVKRGLALMAEHDGVRFGRMLAATGDGTDADAMVQWIVFGALIYG